MRRLKNSLKGRYPKFKEKINASLVHQFLRVGNDSDLLAPIMILNSNLRQLNGTICAIAYSKVAQKSSSLFKNNV